MTRKLGLLAIAAVVASSFTACCDFPIDPFPPGDPTDTLGHGPIDTLGNGGCDGRGPGSGGPGNGGYGGGCDTVVVDTLGVIG